MKVTLVCKSESLNVIRTRPWQLTKLSFDIIKASNLLSKGPLEGTDIFVELVDVSDQGRES